MNVESAGSEKERESTSMTGWLAVSMVTGVPVCA